MKRTVVFILSSTRSGSTWLGYVLGSHSKSAGVGEFYRGWQPGKERWCPFCDARGLGACEALSGVDVVPESEAFRFAFSHLEKRVLVDSSKRTLWAAKFLGTRDFKCKFIHLIRDPRGYYCSERRRVSPERWSELIPRWIRQNARISAFIANSNAPAQVVFYDQIADDPEIEFEKLFDFIGLKFERSALEYWRFPHHGFAANGASSLVVSNVPHARDLPYLVTGDDAFYGAHRNCFFRDRRWEQELTSEEIAAIDTNAEVRSLLERVGISEVVEMQSEPEKSSLHVLGRP